MLEHPPSPIQHLLAERPIVVTGLGVFSAAGRHPGDFFETLLRGVSRAVSQVLGSATIAICPAPPVALSGAGFRRVRTMDRSVQMSLAAADDAWAMAAMAGSGLRPDRLAVIAGTSRGPVGKCAAATHLPDRRRIPPSLAPNTTIAGLSGAIAQALDARGPSWTVSATCASSAHAIALGAQQLLLGLVDAVVVGGGEAPLDPSVLFQMEAAGVLGSDPDPLRACRPFAADRNGTVLGEGAGFLVLETLASARGRGVPPLARLAGWALGADRIQRTGINDVAGCTESNMRASLQMAGLRPEHVGYVHLHGTGTRMNDREEARAIQRVFPQGVPCSSTKPMTGHCMGAAAALGAAVGILAMREGHLPPSVNSQPRDPAANLDLIGPLPREARPAAVLTNAAGFWGTSATLVFTAADEQTSS